MATQIIYDEQVLMELEGGKVATLSCADKEMLTDVEILFEDAGTVTYGDKIIEATAGQQVTLSCAGKQMSSDIVIHTQNAMYQTLYTANNRVYTTQEEQTFTVLESR